jgi:DNA-directed RNA polymerase specialized sigma24 family protein
MRHKSLFYVEDLSVQQIAVVLDCAEGTVKAHLAKARHTLAKRLQLEHGEER